MIGCRATEIAAHGVTNMTARQADLTVKRYDVIVSAMPLHHIPDTRQILGVFHELPTQGG